MANYHDGDMAVAHFTYEDEYVTAFGQVLDGLAHVHSHGIAHRDRKPANLLVQLKPHLSVVIADFGLSKIATDITDLTTFCGTVKYMAPEVFPGTSLYHGVEVGVWSLGVVVLEWIYGIPKPERAPRPGKAMAKVAAEQWQMWIGDWCSNPLDQLDHQDDDDPIAKMLRKILVVKPADRKSAVYCLQTRFKGMWARRDINGRVVCANTVDGRMGDAGVGAWTHVSPVEGSDSASRGRRRRRNAS